MRFLARLALAMIALSGSAGSVAAQQIETPAAFDSAGRVRSLTPQLVERYGLTAPVWPVSGAFVEARMFSLSTGGRMLTIQRASGAVERYPLTDADAEGIRAVIDAATARAGETVSGAQPGMRSSPARNAFARNQMLLSLLVYGPLIATLADDGQTGTALYLLGSGAAFFISLGISKDLDVTRAQNLLATDGAVRGYLATASTLYLVGDDLGRKTYSALGLAGALGGSMLGYQRARQLTDAEAQASATLSTLGAAAAFGTTATIFPLDNTDGRHAVGAMLGGAVVGYALGPEYPRRASYSVTRGDVQLLRLSSILGLGAASAVILPNEGDDLDDQVGFGTLTAGLLAGAVIADRTFIRAFDYSVSDATQIQLASAAGALMGTALAVLIEPPVKGVMALVTGGGIAGALAGHSLANPPRAGAPPAPTRSSSRLRFDPSALALAASGARGNHAVLSLAF